MTSPRTRRRWLAFALLAALTALPALAADKAGKDPAKRLQQQLRLAEQEKAKLAQQVAEGESRVKEAEGKAAEAQGRAAAAGYRNAKLAKELEATKAELDAQAAAAKADKETLSAKLADAERRLADQKRQAETALNYQGKILAGCQERNARMYQLGNELLDQYEQKGCLTSVLQAEPFTGLKRAQIEKMVEEDREKFDRDQILPAAGATAPTR